MQKVSKVLKGFKNLYLIFSLWYFRAFRNWFWMSGAIPSKFGVWNVWCIKATPTWELKCLFCFFFSFFCNFKFNFHSSVEWNVIFKNSARNVVFKEFFRVTLLSFWQPSLISLLCFITSGSNFHCKNYFERKSGNARFLSCENGTFQPYLHVRLCIQNIKGRTQHSPAESLDFSISDFRKQHFKKKIFKEENVKCRKSWSRAQDWLVPGWSHLAIPKSCALALLSVKVQTLLGDRWEIFTSNIPHIQWSPKEVWPRQKSSELAGPGNGWELKSLSLDPSRMPWGGDGRFQPAHIRPGLLLDDACCKKS